MKQMCSFQIRDPCDSDSPQTYHAFGVDHQYDKQCFVQDNVITCSCRDDLCNRDMEVVMRQWSRTRVEDPKFKECVEERLKRIKEELEEEEPPEQKVADTEKPRKTI
ncbi:unnamed protein product [Strongylus vulgaris]|uniref:Uncharacterized protein n=1 Tax=Strongylus vulgaris TaxID=40348 RepID=A0A3P7JJF2_STRVU|nr:unnamed protein product [Strongylus vulgaris]